MQKFGCNTGASSRTSNYVGTIDHTGKALQDVVLEYCLLVVKVYIAKVRNPVAKCHHFGVDRFGFEAGMSDFVFVGIVHGDSEFGILWRERARIMPFLSRSVDSISIRVDLARLS